jgi:hypothetical protein
MTMSKQIPRGDEGLICPLHKAPMEDVCHKCPFWMSIPNNDEHGWKCAFVWMPLMAFTQAKELFAVGKEVNELRNETKTSHDHNVAMGAIAAQRAADAVRSTIAEVVEGQYRPALPLHDADQKSLPSA